MLTILSRADGDAFVPVASADLPALISQPGGLTWVDLEAPVEAEVHILSDVFKFHPLAIEDCLNDHVDPPKVDDYGSYLFLAVQSLDYNTEREALTIAQLNIFLGDSYVVTVHAHPLKSVADVAERCRRGAQAPARGSDWLMHSVLDSLVDQLLPVATLIDERISALEDEALDRPKPELIGRMTSLKRGILRLHRAIAPQRDVINRLSRGDFPRLVRPETFMYYRDVYDHLLRLEEMIADLRDLGDSVISTYLATVNNRMSAVMKALGIVGTIFLPLTLLASVFGTNFAPTYADWGWPGFVAMCIVMVISIAGSLWFFRREGWL